MVVFRNYRFWLWLQFSFSNYLIKKSSTTSFKLLKLKWNWWKQNRKTVGDSQTRLIRIDYWDWYSTLCNYLPFLILIIIKAIENEKFKLKIRNYFQKWAIEWKVSEFWMKGKIILLNKDKGRSPTTESTRPITILPPILKLFELSIIHNFGKVIYEERNLNLNLRGFIKHKATEDNIRDVLNFCYEKRIIKIKKRDLILDFYWFSKGLW